MRIRTGGVTLHVFIVGALTAIALILWLVSADTPAGAGGATTAGEVVPEPPPATESSSVPSPTAQQDGGSTAAPNANQGEPQMKQVPMKAIVLPSGVNEVNPEQATMGDSE